MLTRDGVKVHVGLNENSVGDVDALKPKAEGGFLFTDTDVYELWKKDHTWVFDVEIPEGEIYTAFLHAYKSRRIILSNLRRVSERETTSVRNLCYYIVKKDNHELIQSFHFD
jgi:hypothetical protein